ncbi:Sugar transporter [Musa troglodytarum]|uniref:protein-serine/threonine phosphatase n=1 Tax=Musa troglodytarum TaxID=320322 RepID=A0A9E7H833_9LILI|nr:Sugar transporter [Musa troglodytarum]
MYLPRLRHVSIHHLRILGKGGPLFWRDPHSAMKNAYCSTNKYILENSNQLGHGGSTAVTAIVIDGKDLWIANVGDSRAVLCERGTANQLTVDHEPHAERSRIEKQGGFVTTFPGDVPRVNGQLAVARAFGDKSLRAHLSSEPDVRHIPIDSTIKFVILASDGLWKVMKNEEAIDLVKSIKDPQAAAKRLTTEALARKSKDDISCIIEDGVLSFTVDEALLSIEFGKFQTFVLCYAGMGWISEAMEMMLLSFVGPAVQLEWELSSQQESLITSAVFAGMLLGAYAWGIVSDNYGRRQAIMPRFGWRWLLATSSLPSFLLLLFYAVTPESPRYLCMRGRTSDAMQILEQMARANHKALPSGILISENQLELDEKSDHSEAAHLVGNGRIESSDEDMIHMNMKTSCISTLRSLLSPKLIRSTLLLWMVFFGNAFSYYGIVLLTSELSNGKRACTVKSSQPSHSNDDSLYKDVFVTSFAEVPGLIISAAIVDRIGRKLSMSSMLFISCVFLIPLVFPQTREITTGLLFCARISISASFTIIYIYAPEIYPTSVRASGIGIASSVGRIGGITCPLVAVGLVHGCHQSAAVLLFELVIFLSGIAVCLFPLETSGRDLTDSAASAVSSRPRQSDSFERRREGIEEEGFGFVPEAKRFHISAGMAATQPAPNLIDSREPLEPSIIDAEQKPVTMENLNELPPSAEIEKNVSPDSSAIDHSRDALGQLVSPNAVRDHSASFPAYTHNPQTQMYYYGGPQCQQTVHPSMPYPSSSAPISQIDFTAPVDQEGALLADTANSNSTYFGPRPGYHLSYGASGRDWRIFPDGTLSVSPSPSAAVSIKLGQQIPAYGFGSFVNSYDRWYHNSGGLHHDSTFGMSYDRVGSNGRSLIAAGKITKQERGDASFGRSNGTLEFLSEQNRGPRADGSKDRANQQLLVNESNGVSCYPGVDRKLYNTLDFVTGYKDARFFIIKSYSEDNVHKSIKYGVWASTSNGNRKLNSSYIEMREQEHSYPIFLFFSVNASGHFCGVAEMIGPVDFEKSVDYWNKDKWTGQCPVKWHIVKDVPNTMFRHIILENNDNKPVTNSRDTQEVKLEQGLEMLSIFNKHENEESILDDFEFYEERETALRQRKACEHPILTNSINQISSSFAQAVLF